MSRRLIPAREYLRVSKDRSGRQRSIDEQHDDNVAAAKREGWKLGTPYRDKESASRYARNGRHGFDALLADLDADRFDAELLVMWESSRGSRKTGEWVNLIDLCEKRAVRIAVTTHGPRTYDPANPRDRRTLLEDAVDSEYESAKISLRGRRAAAAAAAAGRPHGPAPYGYRSVYDSSNGKLANWVPDPEEAPFIIEAFERIGAGDSLRNVANDLAARGMVGRRGVPVNAGVLRPMLLAPLYAGLRSHSPGVVKRHHRSANATVVEGVWVPLVSRELYLAVRARLTDPARKTTRPGRGVHLLSMIAVCQHCDAVITATYRNGRRMYQCRGRNCIRVDADGLDKFARDKMLEFLAKPDNVERLTADDDDDQDVAATRERVADIEAEHRDLGRQLGAGEISATLAAGAEPAILARLRRAKEELAELTTPPTLRGLISPGVEVTQWWEDAPTPAKREVARLLLSPAVIGELRVERSPRPGHAVDVAERVVWRR